jgi:UDP-N-acetylglucosamine 1-carboxyvinyltransferase
LQIICATLLTSEKITISNIPDISDVNLLIELMSDFGVEVKNTKPVTIPFERKM